MTKAQKLNPPITLRLTPTLENEITRLANANGLAVTSQIRLLLSRGLNTGKPAPKKRVGKN